MLPVGAGVSGVLQVRVHVTGMAFYMLELVFPHGVL